MSRSLLLIFVLIPACAFSQAITATLLGTVADASGAVVPEASVVATEVTTGITRKASSNQEGIYTIPYLAPGTYKVEIEAKGFKKMLRDRVELRATTSTRVDAVLELGQVNEVVNVTAESPVIQTDRSEVSRSFNSKAVSELPLVDRSFQSLLARLSHFWMA